MDPKVSVIIPVYNGADYLGQAIDSALAQTYKNIEIIVVNDGSNDNGATDNLARSYGDKIKYFSKPNGGVSTALNTGIRRASGEWISWLSHDDLYTPDKIETQVKDMLRLKKNNVAYDRVMFYCGTEFINAEGEKIPKNSHMIPSGLYKGNDMLFEMFRGSVIAGCALLIPKKMFYEIGFFDEDMRYMQDVFMWEKAFIGGYSIYINNRAMSITRIHMQQVSTTGIAYAFKDRDKVGSYLAEHLKGIYTSNGESVLKQYLWFCYRNNSLITAKKIYMDLKNAGELTISQKVDYKVIEIYGRIRKKLVPVYYLVKFKTRR